MTLELNIQGKQVGFSEITFEGLSSLAKRKNLVEECLIGMRNIFWKQMLATEDWEVVLICQSKMNDENFTE